MKDKKNSQYGTMWINNGTTNKKIKKEETIPKGWYKGRVNVHTEESKKILREHAKNCNPEKRKETILKRYGTFLTTNRKKAIAEYYQSQHELKSSLDFEKKSIKYKRIYILEEQDNSCLWCGIKEWNGKSIILELDHIDGNTNNNSRENLRFLCPNCHSQTDTWRKSWKSKNGDMV